MRQPLFSRLYKNEQGETLVETLVSVLIVSAVFLMLSTAIVTAANINAKAVKIDSNFNADADDVELLDADEYELSIGVATDGSLDPDTYSAYMQNGYFFYKHGRSDQSSNTASEHGGR